MSPVFTILRFAHMGLLDSQNLKRQYFLTNVVGQLFTMEN